MQTYQVDDMTCGHCASSISKAIRAVDAGARIEVDLAAHQVRIQPTEADAEELRDAIAQAGYTPVAVPASDAPRSGTGAAARSGGCCCGSGASACRS